MNKSAGKLSPLIRAISRAVKSRPARQLAAGAAGYGYGKLLQDQAAGGLDYRTPYGREIGPMLQALLWARAGGGRKALRGAFSKKHPVLVPSGAGVVPRSQLSLPKSVMMLGGAPAISGGLRRMLGESEPGEVVDAVKRLAEAGGQISGDPEGYASRLAEGGAQGFTKYVESPEGQKAIAGAAGLVGKELKQPLTEAGKELLSAAKPEAEGWLAKAKEIAPLMGAGMGRTLGAMGLGGLGTYGLAQLLLGGGLPSAQKAFKGRTPSAQELIGYVAKREKSKRIRKALISLLTMLGAAGAGAGYAYRPQIAEFWRSHVGKK